MADTKKLSREERKRAKRVARRDLKLAFSRLSGKEKREYRKGEIKSLKAFLKKLEEKKREEEKEGGRPEGDEKAAEAS